MHRTRIDLRIGGRIRLYHRLIESDIDTYICRRLNFLPVSHDPDIEESCQLLRKHPILIKTHSGFRLFKIFLVCARATLNFCNFKNRIFRNLCLCTICERNSIISAPYSKSTAFGFTVCRSAGCCLLSGELQLLIDRPRNERNNIGIFFKIQALQSDARDNAVFIE